MGTISSGCRHNGHLCPDRKVSSMQSKWNGCLAAHGQWARPSPN